ncbi:hypothetical protein IP84_01165 [beta proteobacterium AAP99]|nr:hypothetical protein IP84_01165 [beta proteobacterium AAP99]
MTDHPEAQPPAHPAQAVLDTNAVLDLFVFRDPAAQALRRALQAGALRWIVTPHLLEELRRVLAYPAVQAWAPHGNDASAWMQARMSEALELATLHAAEIRPCPVRCLDADDQPFLDLAFTLACPLISKDKRVRQAARRARMACVATGDELLALRAAH